MAEDVCDSWEDMIDENGVLDKKLQQLRIVESKPQMRPIMTSSDINSKIDLNNGSLNSVFSSMKENNTSNDSLNAIKILKRPTNAGPVNREVSGDLNACHTDVKQIMLEDNTRTQYVPQVRILKRPNAKPSNESHTSMSSNDRKSLTANKTQSNSKTYEEREAEYAKARLRILGSASAQEESNSCTDLSQIMNSSTSCNAFSPNSRSNKSDTALDSKVYSSNPKQKDDFILNNVPVIRLPQGPDGTKGFNFQKR